MGRSSDADRYTWASRYHAAGDTPTIVSHQCSAEQLRAEGTSIGLLHMPRGPVAIKQADISRAIRAMKAAGYEVRVVVTARGTVVEPVLETDRLIDTRFPSEPPPRPFTG